MGKSAKKSNVKAALKSLIQTWRLTSNGIIGDRHWKILSVQKSVVPVSTLAWMANVPEWLRQSMVARSRGLPWLSSSSREWKAKAWRGIVASPAMINFAGTWRMNTVKIETPLGELVVGIILEYCIRGLVVDFRYTGNLMVVFRSYFTSLYLEQQDQDCKRSFRLVSIIRFLCVVSWTVYNEWKYGPTPLLFIAIAAHKVFVHRQWDCTWQKYVETYGIPDGAL